MEVLQSNATTTEAAFIQAARSALTRADHKIHHCVRQLTDEQVWHRERPEMNSIANLILHLCGNLRQWIISAVSEAPDFRNRPAEFADRSEKSKEQLIDEFSAVIQECDRVLSKSDPKSLLQVRRIQGFDLQLLAAIFDTISHLQGHVQEIIHMTRALRGADYRFDFVPQGKEQDGVE